MEGSQMTGINLRVATLKNAKLKNCNLRGATLAGTDLEVRTHTHTQPLNPNLNLWYIQVSSVFPRTVTYQDVTFRRRTWEAPMWREPSLRRCWLLCTCLRVCGKTFTTHTPPGQWSVSGMVTHVCFLIKQVNHGFKYVSFLCFFKISKHVKSLNTHFLKCVSLWIRRCICKHHLLTNHQTGKFVWIVKHTFVTVCFSLRASPPVDQWMPDYVFRSEPNPNKCQHVWNTFDVFVSVKDGSSSAAQTRPCVFFGSEPNVFVRLSEVFNKLLNVVLSCFFRINLPLWSS